ncbi:MAG: YbhB/YbcL family Raf kinase inhibitor-like protein, partial [Pseudolabrys sp.]
RNAMFGIRQTLSAVATVLLLAGTAHADGVFTITSSAFKDGTLLAKKNAGANKSNPNCVGENVSPPLAWTNVPAGTTSFALVMTDPEGRGTGVDHWIAYGIPASVTSFAEGETSKPSDKYVGGIGTAKQNIYMGPCTPPGSPHHYTFVLIATDLDPKALPPGLTKLELFDKLNGHVKGSTGIIGLFKNPL